jgi:succinate dehydrogenase/fumarate reductase flavoprotein subunit
MGWHCGQVAAERAKNQVGFLQIDQERVENARELCMNLLGSQNGYRWQEAGYALQNLMDDYCGEVRTGQMLLRGLDRLKDIRTMPLKAVNPHELGRCLEVRFLVEAGEMVMRASHERQESRKYPTRFQRADYPEQDDERWFAFLAIRREKNRYTFSKMPIE